MTIRVSIFAAIAAVILLTVIFELIRSRRLHERYAILWLITGGVIFVLAVWRDALGTLASTVGIAYPPSALFVLALLFILIVLLHYSTVISKLAVQNRILAQRLALLESGMGLIEERFEIVYRADFGGTLLQFVLSDIAGNFDPADPKDVAMIDLVCLYEKTLIDEGVLPSDFVYLVARRSS